MKGVSPKLIRSGKLTIETGGGVISGEEDGR